jgi:hypothetical protein
MWAYSGAHCVKITCTETIFFHANHCLLMILSLQNPRGRVTSSLAAKCAINVLLCKRSLKTKSLFRSIIFPRRKLENYEGHRLNKISVACSPWLCRYLILQLSEYGVISGNRVIRLGSVVRICVCWRACLIQNSFLAQCTSTQRKPVC